MLENFMKLLERIADALEVIAASGNAGLSAPRTATTAAADDPKKADAAKKAAEKAAKDKAAKDKAKEKEVKDASDPLAAAEDSSDPLGDGGAKSEYTEKDVRDMLGKLIEKEGRAAAFKVLKEKGNGAKSFTDLKKEHFEDVYVEAKEQLGE